MIALFPIRDLLLFPGSALCRASLAVAVREALPGAREEGETGGSSFRRRRKVFRGPCASEGPCGRMAPDGAARGGAGGGVGGEGAMSRRVKRLDEGWNAVVASSWHAEFVYADVSYFNKERKAPYLRLRECCEERFARCSFAEDGTHRAMFPFGGWSARTPLAELACLRSGFKRAFRIDCIAGEERSIRTISGHVLIN